jgi:integrase
MTTDYPINVESGRKKLPPRPTEPYWRAIARGRALGYWKGKNAETETWRARWRDLRTGEEHRKVLGRAAELNYSAALRAAQEWWDTECQAGVPKASTVEAACKDYLDIKLADRTPGSVMRTRKAFEKTISGTRFGAMKLDELRDTDVEAWKRSLYIPGQREKNSANRIIRSFKAAMNFARKRKRVSTDNAWKLVDTYPEQDGRRERVLTQIEVKTLIDAAEPHVADYIAALYYTGARPDEIAKCRVADLDVVANTLHLFTRKGNGQLRRRDFPLNVHGPKVVAFFRGLAKSKLPAAPLVSYFDGSHFQKHQWHRGIVSARADAALGDDVVAYSLRHTAITSWLSAGIDIATVAKWAGTSIVMIDKHYHSYLPNSAEGKLAHLAV